MSKIWLVCIDSDFGNKEYRVTSEDSYDAKVEALSLFYEDFNNPARLADVISCKVVEV